MVELPDGPTEESTERDGVLSYAGEWHALIIGLVVGFAAAMTGQWALVALLVAAALGLEGAKRISSKKVLVELRSEPWYGLGGGAIGTALGLLVSGVGTLPI